MAKKKDAPGQKPPEVKELERALAMTLHESQNIEEPESYLSDSSGAIIQLGLGELDIRSVDPFKDLKYLRRLNLTKNEIGDIKPLTSLLQIDQLYLGGNYIESISPLLSLQNITSLAIWDNPIQDVQELR